MFRSITLTLLLFVLVSTQAEEELPPYYIVTSEPSRDADQALATRIQIYHSFLHGIRKGVIPISHLGMHYPNISESTLHEMLDDFAQLMADVQSTAADRKSTIVCAGKPEDGRAIYARLRASRAARDGLIVKRFNEFTTNKESEFRRSLLKHMNAVAEGTERISVDPEAKNRYLGVSDEENYDKLCEQG